MFFWNKNVETFYYIAIAVIYITNKPQEAYVTVDLPRSKDAVMHNGSLLYSTTPVLSAWRCSMRMVA